MLVTSCIISGVKASWIVYTYRLIFIAMWWYYKKDKKNNTFISYNNNCLYFLYYYSMYLTLKIEILDSIKDDVSKGITVKKILKYLTSQGVRLEMWKACHIILFKENNPIDRY